MCCGADFIYASRAARSDSDRLQLCAGHSTEENDRDVRVDEPQERPGDPLLGVCVTACTALTVGLRCGHSSREHSNSSRSSWLYFKVLLGQVENSLMIIYHRDVSGLL